MLPRSCLAQCCRCPQSHAEGCSHSPSLHKGPQQAAGSSQKMWDAKEQSEGSLRAEQHFSAGLPWHVQQLPEQGTRDLHAHFMLDPA